MKIDFGATARNRIKRFHSKGYWLTPNKMSGVYITRFRWNFIIKLQKFRYEKLLRRPVFRSRNDSTSIGGQSARFSGGRTVSGRIFYSRVSCTLPLSSSRPSARKPHPTKAGVYDFFFYYRAQCFIQANPFRKHSLRPRPNVLLFRICTYTEMVNITIFSGVPRYLIAPGELEISRSVLKRIFPGTCFFLNYSPAAQTAVI